MIRVECSAERGIADPVETGKELTGQIPRQRMGAVCHRTDEEIRAVLKERTSIASAVPRIRKRSRGTRAVEQRSHDLTGFVLESDRLCQAKRNDGRVCHATAGGVQIVRALAGDSTMTRFLAMSTKRVPYALNSTPARLLRTSGRRPFREVRQDSRNQSRG